MDLVEQPDLPFPWQTCPPNPLDDFLELSRLLACAFPPSGFPTGLPPPSDPSTTPYPPPQISDPDQPAADPPTRPLPADEPSIWIRDFPFLDYDSLLGDDMNGSSHFLHLPELSDDDASSLHAPASHRKHIEAAIGDLQEPQKSPPYGGSLDLSTSSKNEVPIYQELKSSSLTGSSEGVLFSAEDHREPRDFYSDELLDMHIVEKLQLSHQSDVKCYHLSIEDAKTITLKVSKLPKTNDSKELSSFGHHLRADEQHLEKSVHTHQTQGALSVDVFPQESLVEMPKMEVDDQTFEDCIALELQDIAPLDSFTSIDCQKPHIRNFAAASPRADFSTSDVNVEQILSSSLSTLSTTENPKDYFIGFCHPQGHSSYQHSSSLNTTHPVRPYNGFEETMLKDNTWESPNLNHELTSHHIFSFPHAVPKKMEPLVSQIITPSPTIANCKEKILYPNFGYSDNASYSPNIIHEQGCCCDALSFTRSLFPSSSLSWRSPAAKTRAVRKRRMARKLLHVVPYQPVVSPAWSVPKAVRRSKRGGPRSDHRRRAQFSSDKNFEFEVSCIDKKNLRFLLEKELKPSDVGSMGRIIIPKKDAETYLPELLERTGVAFPMNDIDVSHVWPLKYRFWPNNKSRMYLLDNARDFIQYHHLREGDHIKIYIDELTGRYVIQSKKYAN